MEIKGDYGKISDMRLKENVSPIVNVLNKINHIQPIYYNLKNNNETFTNRHIGFSAQELQKEFPELVVQNKDGHLSARYDNMTAVLLQGVKEQQQQIEGLKAQKNQQELFNQQLIKQNEALIKRLEKLEQKSTD